MVHVKKADILAVVRELWGSTGVIEDEAKLIVAERLIADMWEGKKSGIPMDLAGYPVKQALGSRWLGSDERRAAGKPVFSEILSQDPYFTIKVLDGAPQPYVKLRVSRLAQLIENPQLIKEYRNPGSAATVTGHPAGTAHASSSKQTGIVQLTNEGLPIRPGQPVCQHYVKHGWCLFKQDCWYSHPRDRAPNGRAAGAGQREVFIESTNETGVMLRDGIYPIRPKRPPCTFYLKHGWCLYKAKCWNNHPALDVSAMAAAAAGNPLAASPTQDMPDQPLVKQPSAQLLLGIVVDSVWPPRASKESYIKGQLAKYIISLQLEPSHMKDPAKTYNILMAPAGIHLSKWWSTQNLYDPMIKPYKSLAEVLKDDIFYQLGHNHQQLTLLLGDLISIGGQIAADKLAQMADIVWPPTAGRETFLRGKLAKWLLTAGFSGENGAVLRQVLAVGPDAPTVFRIDIAQAGEYLKRCWELQDHPYDASLPPWTQLKPLIAGDRYLYIEPAPGRPNSHHVTIDVTEMLENYQAAARAARAARGAQLVRYSSQDNSFGLSSRGAGSSSAAAEELLQLEDDDEAEQMMNPLVESAWPSSSVTETGASSSTGAQQQQQSVPSSSRRPSSALSANAGDPVTEAEAELAAIIQFEYEPPSSMQRWWPQQRPEHPHWAWTEIAIRLVDPTHEDAVLQLAEMAQHLEICPIVGVTCATYKYKPILLQFFAPHAAVGDLEMPSVVYLLDIMRPGPQVQEVIDLIRPVFSSPLITKVTHGSKLWSGQLEQLFNIHLRNYYDTQQANFVWNCLRHEAGKAPQMTGQTLKSTEQASMSALLRSHDFYHPVRQAAKEHQLVWQERPLSEELITCAAADVVYLLPLLEVQVRAIRTIASEIYQRQQQRSVNRSAVSVPSLPPVLSSSEVLQLLAAGVETQAGLISTDKIHKWGELDAFHQLPLH